MLCSAGGQSRLADRVRLALLSAVRQRASGCVVPLLKV
jgi:hypothetical protein